jgi:hypothetical protein
MSRFISFGFSRGGWETGLSLVDFISYILAYLETVAKDHIRRDSYYAWPVGADYKCIPYVREHRLQVSLLALEDMGYEKNPYHFHTCIFGHF